jgi:cyclopropane fatty-acyl-phospholipid synthase-like methyltransferase
MLRYHLAAAALRSLSSSALTRRFYRDVLGNRMGARRRLQQGLEPAYVVKAGQFLDLARRHGGVRDGMRLLELGTGWMHFYAIFIRLFHDVSVTLVDVWDNRQLEALQHVFRQLDAQLDTSFELSPAERERAHALLEVVDRVSTYDELYARLGFEYRIDPTGVHAALPDDHFDLIFSFDVLEHVNREDVLPLLRNTTRLLRPGGVQLHLIGIADHLTNYDSGMSWKNYIRYSDRAWKAFFENDVQYINRIQRSEWLAMFRTCGLRVLEESRMTCDVSRLKPSVDFSRFDRTDLECVVLTVALQKEPRNGAPGGGS